MYFRVIQPGKMIFASVSEKFLNIFSREFYVFFFFFLFHLAVFCFLSLPLSVCAAYHVFVVLCPTLCQMCLKPKTNSFRFSFAAPRFLFYAIGLSVERCDDHSGNGDRPPTLALSVCGCLLFILAACGTIIVQSIC